MTGFRVNTGYHETPDKIAKALATQPHLEIQPHYPVRPGKQKTNKENPNKFIGDSHYSIMAWVFSPFQNKLEASHGICECWH